MRCGTVIIKNCATIVQGSFQNNDRISRVIIGKGVISIGKDAFSGCENLKIVFVPESVDLIDETAFKGSGVLWKIPKKSKDEYTSRRVLLIYCKKNSYADKWFGAQKKNYIIVYY